jgi:hypothetical protein
MNAQLRKTLIALLDDEDGISSEGYNELYALAMSIAPGENTDIFIATEGCDGRFFLPEDHGLTA